MAFGVAAREPCEHRLPVEGLEPATESGGADHPVQPLRVLRQRLADQPGEADDAHPDAARREALPVGQLEVESGAGALRVLARAAARIR